MTSQSTSETGALSAILDILDLEVLEVNLFRGQSPQIGRKRVYGGQVLAQALVAALRTVPDGRAVHSLHSYFLLGGDPAHPIVFEVERTRDGSSFTTRRVKAIQHGKTIFSMSASFHRSEDGLEHQIAMPDVPGPEELPSLVQIIRSGGENMPEHMRKFAEQGHAIEVRPVDTGRILNPQPGPPQQCVWVRTYRALPDDANVHACLLAYASDVSLLETALVAHGRLIFDRDLQFASLDHALWFHRPFRADEWLLYAQDSPSAGGARGFCRGHFFTVDGQLVASAAQEGLMRKRRKA